MKVLIIHTHYTQYGGEDTVVKQEANFLQENHDVKTLYFKNKNGASGLWQFLISIWNVTSAYRVRKEIKRFKPEIIHIHNWHFASGPIIIRTAKKMGIPIINTLHNYRLICPSGILLKNNELFLDSLKQDFPWTAVTKKVYKNSSILTFWLAFIVWFHRKIGTWSMIDTYVCLTPPAIDIFTSSWMRVLKSKFTSKPNFSTATVAKKANSNRESHYLFIGRLSEEKGIKMLIDTFKKLPYKLKIAGDGPLKEYVLRSASINRNIIYLGVLTKDEVSNELKTANALIFSSIWLETFGLVITEAFSNSCAVISTDIGAPKAIVFNEKNGLNFESNNINSLQKAIKKWETFTLVEKESIRKNALKTYLEKYSSENQHQYFKNIYRKVLKKNCD